MALRPAPQRRRVRLLRPRRGGRRRVEVSSGGGLELRPAIRGRAPPFRTDVGLRRWLRPERRRVAGLRRRTGAKNEILDALSRLVDKSLVAAPNAGRYARFTQLQTLWQYGRDRLNDSGEVDALCARHAAYYRQMAEGAHEGLRGAAGPMWRERLTSDLANLRAALDWFIARCDADGGDVVGVGNGLVVVYHQRLCRRSTLAW